MQEICQNVKLLLHLQTKDFLNKHTNPANHPLPYVSKARPRYLVHINGLHVCGSHELFNVCDVISLANESSTL